MNELAKTMIDDGQSIRSVFNYLSETFDGIKNKELYDHTFTDRIEFIEFIREIVCPMMIMSLCEWKLDNPEGYELSNSKP